MPTFLNRSTNRAIVPVLWSTPDLGIQVDVQAAIEAIRRILEGVIQVGQWVGGETHALTPCAELRLGWLRRSDVG